MAVVKRWLVGVGVIVVCALWHSPARSAPQQAQGGPDSISVRTASVDGLNIQYLWPGEGRPSCYCTGMPKRFGCGDH
jgi:hypothetical protein